MYVISRPAACMPGHEARPCLVVLLDWKHYYLFTRGIYYYFFYHLQRRPGHTASLNAVYRQGVATPECCFCSYILAGQHCLATGHTSCIIMSVCKRQPPII
jgi:hypothetical protein